jgi:hypothetical protein
MRVGASAFGLALAPIAPFPYPLRFLHRTASKLGAVGDLHSAYHLDLYRLGERKGAPRGIAPIRRALLPTLTLIQIGAAAGTADLLTPFRAAWLAAGKP